MIDEKKIEEAAEKYSGRYFGLPRELRCGERCFKAGINWLLENLWHDVSEEPEKDRTILCEYLNCNNKKVYADIDLEREYDCYKSSLSNITRWLYIEDLMKGGK